MVQKSLARGLDLLFFYR